MYGNEIKLIVVNLPFIGVQILTISMNEQFSGYREVNTSFLLVFLLYIHPKLQGILQDLLQFFQWTRYLDFQSLKSNLFGLDF